MPWTLTRLNVALAASATAAVGLTAVLLSIGAQDRVHDAGGPAVSIAVVDPREPVVTPGGVMEVGAVVDGYEHRAPQPVPHDPMPDEGYRDDPLPMPEPRRWTSQPPVEPSPREAVVTVRAEGRPMSFGFDEPMPDYAAQRRERQARMDRMAAEAAMRAQAPTGAELDPEAEFY